MKSPHSIVTLKKFYKECLESVYSQSILTVKHMTNDISFTIRLMFRLTPCDYSNRGHLTKFSTNLTTKYRGG